MDRRHFLTLLAGLGGTACGTGPVLVNPCLPARLPENLANHDLVRQAFAGLRPDHIWDGHVHLLGLGDSGSGRGSTRTCKVCVIRCNIRNYAFT